MKKMVFILAVFAVLVMGLYAFDGNIEITNDTGFDIFLLYVSHENADDWGDDVLGDEVLGDGETVTVNLEGYISSIFDILAEDEDGDTYTLWALDAASDDIVITLDHLDL